MSSVPQLFIPCLVSTFRPHIVQAAQRVLRRVTGDVHIPHGQTCCGQPAYNVGVWEEARRMARYTLTRFEAHPGPVVVLSGSCAAMLRQVYPRLLAADPTWQSRAQALAARTFEFSEYLVEQLGVVEVGAVFPYRVAYHPSCHLTRGLGVIDPPLRLLRAVKGLQLVPFEDAEACCGFGGAFSAEQPEIAAAMLHRKLEHLAAAQPEVVVSADLGCLLHLAGGMPRRRGLPVRHLAEVLAHTV